MECKQFMNGIASAIEEWYPNEFASDRELRYQLLYESFQFYRSQLDH
jgi:hypothetical protein